MANNKQKLKVLKTPNINQVIYDCAIMYIKEVLGVSNIPDNTPIVVQEVIEKVKQSYINSSPVQGKYVQVDLEDAIKIEKYGK